MGDKYIHAALKKKIENILLLQNNNKLFIFLANIFVSAEGTSANMCSLHVDQSSVWFLGSDKQIPCVFVLEPIYAAKGQKRSHANLSYLKTK